MQSHSEMLETWDASSQWRFLSLELTIFWRACQIYGFNFFPQLSVESCFWLLVSDVIAFRRFENVQKRCGFQIIHTIWRCDDIVHIYIVNHKKKKKYLNIRQLIQWVCVCCWLPPKWYAWMSVFYTIVWSLFVNAGIKKRFCILSDCRTGKFLASLPFHTTIIELRKICRYWNIINNIVHSKEIILRMNT